MLPFSRIASLSLHRSPPFVIALHRSLSSSLLACESKMNLFLVISDISYNHCPFAPTQLPMVTGRYNGQDWSARSKTSCTRQQPIVLLPRGASGAWLLRSVARALQHSIYADENLTFPLLIICFHNTLQPHPSHGNTDLFSPIILAASPIITKVSPFYHLVSPFYHLVSLIITKLSPNYRVASLLPALLGSCLGLSLATGFRVGWVKRFGAPFSSDTHHFATNSVGEACHGLPPSECKRHFCQ
jgi:hypothetical protein